VSTSVRAAELLLVAAVLVTSACGSKKSETLTLYAGAQRTIAAKDIVTGETVVCMTHGSRIRGELPDPASLRDSTPQASGVDYADASGGTLSISSDRTRVTITCR